MAYNINFQALALWIGVAAVVGGGYFVVSSDSSQQNSFSIGMEEDTVPGELTRLSVEQGGEPIQGANISIDSEFIGTTNSQGIKGFETPENNFTVEASKGDISSETTFTVEDGSFSSPDDSEGSESDDDSNNSDGSDNDGEDDDSDDSNDSDNEDSNQDSSEDDQQDSSEDTSETVDDFTGLEIDEDPMIGELRTLTVYDKGEEVSGAEVTVNGEVVGTTNAGGTVTFGVPNTAEISVSTDTGLSETFTIEDYTEDEQNQTDDQNDTEDLTTGIQLDSDPVSGTNNRIILYDQGDRVSGETVYLDDEELGQTGSNGAIEFEVPLQEQITVTTDYGLESQTFNVTEEHPEPKVTLLSPDSGEEFETLEGENTDIEFKASIEITENSGTASLMIDGSEAYTQELSQGENTIDTTEALSGGSHSWSIEVDTPEFNTSSSTRILSITEVESQEGLELQGNATAEEFVTVALYQNNEPVQGEELFINQESIGTTDEFGELQFQVPNTQEIMITTQSGIDELTTTVQGYSPDTANIQIVDPESGESETNYTADIAFDAESTFDDSLNYVVLIGNQEVDTGEFFSSINYEESFDVYQTGQKTLEIEILNSNGEMINSSTRNFEIQEQPPQFNLISPVNEQVNDYNTQLEFDLNTDIGGELRTFFDGSLTDSVEISKGSTSRQIDLQNIEQSTHDWYVEFEDSQGRVYQSSVANFETTESPPEETIDIEQPLGYGSYSAGEIELRAEIIVDEESNYEYLIDGQVVHTGQISPRENLESYNHQINSGEHTFEVVVEYSDGSKTMNATRQFTVE